MCGYWVFQAVDNAGCSEALHLSGQWCWGQVSEEMGEGRQAARLSSTAPLVCGLVSAAMDRSGERSSLPGCWEASQPSQL